MQASIKTSSRKTPVEHLMAASSKRRHHSYKESRAIKPVEDRLLWLKRQVLIDELTQIMMFIRELERFGFGNSETLDRIRNLLIKIQFMCDSDKYLKIIQIVAKYLVGVRNFSSSTSMSGILFYKNLFESMITVIMWELDMMEKESY